LSNFYIHPLTPIFTLNNLANKIERSGTADLPLHYGKVPPWLYGHMSSLGFSIIEVILIDYGKEEVLRRLADPFWFQSFGAVMGMDWHSSGITTSVMGALKRAINPAASSLGIYICGGRTVFGKAQRILHLHPAINFLYFKGGS